MSYQQTIAFNGESGTFADMACRKAFPKFKTLPCSSFKDALDAVRNHKATYAMIPIDNSLAGRVMDVHHLLPQSGLHIIAEHFLRIEQHIMGLKNAKLNDIKAIISHEHALQQCKKMIHEKKWQARSATSTTAAAKIVTETKDPTTAAIASELAAKLFNLKILKKNVEDSNHNTTRFVVMGKEALPKIYKKGDYITSFVFRVRHVPAALYKALGGFATNGINLLKLESYISEGSFIAAQFYVEAGTHLQSAAMKHALDELKFYTDNITILGCYEADAYRKK